MWGIINIRGGQWVTSSVLLLLWWSTEWAHGHGQTAMQREHASSIHPHELSQAQRRLTVVDLVTNWPEPGGPWQLFRDQPINWTMRTAKQGNTPKVNLTNFSMTNTSTASTSLTKLNMTNVSTTSSNTTNSNMTNSAASSPRMTNPRRPLIYVYPPVDRFLALPERSIVHHRGFYSLDFLWPHMLHKSPYVTADPSEADYFMWPSYLYYGKNRSMREMIDMARMAGPWFNRSGGADHIWVVTDDFGACPYNWDLPEKAIVIHHWGRVYDARSLIPCKYEQYFGSWCDDQIKIEEEYLQRRPHWRHWPCHKPYQYIVTPPGSLFEARDPKEPFPTHQFNKVNRSTLLFYAGPMPQPIHEAAYSFGVRQTTYAIYKNDPDFKFYLKHIHNYSDEIQNSIFCLAPAGWGWGGRMKAAILNGCIPVVIQPDVKVEWEEQLPLFEYALRLPFYAIHKLGDILRDLVKKGRPAKMLQAMQCAWRFHYWQHPEGRAFDLVMCELLARKMGKKVHLDVTTCTLECGDGIKRPVHTSTPYMV